MIFPRALLISFRDNIIGITVPFLFDFSHATTTTVTPWLQMAVHTIISASESAAVDETMLFPVDLNKRTPRKLPQSAEKNSVDSFYLFYFSFYRNVSFILFVAPFPAHSQTRNKATTCSVL
jgi:hypothetical protein